METSDHPLCHIRAYGRTELAQCYLPHLTPEAAWNKLKIWIYIHPHLSATLLRLGYNGHQRTFTPAQVKAIFDALGEP